MPDQSVSRDDHTAEQAENAMLLDFVRGRDVNCPLCGYNLRDLTSPQCPECGRTFKLTIGLSEPYLRWWIILAAAIFASSGIGLLASTAIIHEQSWSWPGDNWGMSLAFIYYFLSVPCACVVVFTRRRFLRLSIAAQRALAIGAWLAFIASGVLLFVSTP